MSVIQSPHNITYSGDETMEYILRPAVNVSGLEAYIKVLTKVKVKQQVSFISQLDKITTEDSGCDPVYNDKQAARSEKYWDPQPVEAALRQCYTDLKGTSLEKKLNGGTEIPYLKGTEIERLLLSLMVPAAARDYVRMLWLGDKDITAAQLTNGNADVKYYKPINGFFKRIKTGVTASLIPRFSIAQNTATTETAQALPAGEGKKILRGVYNKAKLILKQYDDKQKVFFVTRSVYDNYAEELEDNKQLESASVQLQGGVKALAFRGIPLVILDVVDTYLDADFKLTSGGNTAVTEPHRVVLTVKENLQASVDTDTEEPESFETWDEKKEKRWYARMMYKADTQIGFEELVSVGY